jgi:hypothetical protein
MASCKEEAITTKSIRTLPGWVMAMLLTHNKVCGEAIVWGRPEREIIMGNNHELGKMTT